MTRARYQQVSLQDTPYYHCISRCVRRAYLFGDDPVTGKNFDHRKQWLVSRIKTLAAQFSIDICAYAIMSNHYHLVLFVNEIKEFFSHENSLRCFDGHCHHDGSRLVASRDQIKFLDHFLCFGSDRQIP